MIQWFLGYTVTSGQPILGLNNWEGGHWIRGSHAVEEARGPHFPGRQNFGGGGAVGTRVPTKFKAAVEHCSGDQ